MLSSRECRRFNRQTSRLARQRQTEAGSWRQGAWAGVAGCRIRQSIQFIRITCVLLAVVRQARCVESALQAGFAYVLFTDDAQRDAEFALAFVTRRQIA